MDVEVVVVPEVTVVVGVTVGVVIAGGSGPVR